GQPVHGVWRRAPAGLCQCAAGQGPRRGPPAAAAHRRADHGRDRVRVHGRGDLRPQGPSGQDRHCRPRAEAAAGHHRPAQHAQHAGAGAAGVGAGRAVPRHRVVHGHPLPPARRGAGQPAAAPGLPGVQPHQRHLVGQGAAHGRARAAALGGQPRRPRGAGGHDAGRRLRRHRLWQRRRPSDARLQLRHLGPQHVVLPRRLRLRPPAVPARNQRGRLQPRRRRVHRRH
ncbi:hypothetical protein EV174_007007, partial [Coemansia sp. RSA 2320]